MARTFPFAGQAEASFQVGEYVGMHKVLVIKEMIQECLTGNRLLGGFNLHTYSIVSLM